MFLFKPYKQNRNFSTALILIVGVVFFVNAQNQTCSESSYSFTEQYDFLHTFTHPDIKNYGIKANSSNGFVEVRVYDSFWLGKELAPNDGLIWGTRIENINATNYQSFGWLVYSTYIDRVSNHYLINYGPMLTDEHKYFEMSKVKLVTQKFISTYLDYSINKFISYSALKALNNYSVTVTLTFGGETKLEDLIAIKIPYIGVLTRDEIIEKLKINCPNYRITKVKSENIVSEQKEFKIYPNPSKGDINLIAEVKEAGKIKIQMIDLLGKVVYEKIFNDVSVGFQQIALNNLALKAGVYIVKVINGNHQQTSRLVMEE